MRCRHGLLLFDDSLSDCHVPSLGFGAQNWLNGSTSCFGRRLFGDKKHCVLKTEVLIPMMRGRVGEISPIVQHRNTGPDLDPVSAGYSCRPKVHCTGWGSQSPMVRGQGRGTQCGFRTFAKLLWPVVMRLIHTIRPLVIYDCKVNMPSSFHRILGVKQWVLLYLTLLQFGFWFFGTQYICIAFRPLLYGTRSDYLYKSQ